MKLEAWLSMNSTKHIYIANMEEESGPDDSYLLPWEEFCDTDGMSEILRKEWAVKLRKFADELEAE